jgi:ABC-type multidrug transport system ATPase subunit
VVCRGTKRKVNVLIGLLSNPQILILDEPTVGIDLKSRFDIVPPDKLEIVMVLSFKLS